MKNTISKKAIIISLFASFCCAGCFIRIPVPGGIPIVIQEMLCMLSGLILGPIYGSLSVLVFLLLGGLGLPVFSGGGGFDKIFNGPTGGFLIGYFVAAFTGGLIVQIFVKDERKILTNTDGSTEISEPEKITVILNWIFITLAAILATVTVFALGILGFHRIKPDLEMSRVYGYVLIPFIPGNIIKILIMIPLTKKIRPFIKGYLS